MTIWIKRGILALAAVFWAAAAIMLILMQSAARSVPVLNYHQINDQAENALTIHTDQFEAQMKYLADNGFHTITPDEMLDAWENGTPLPDKPVILTFDDGYADNYRNAFPILEKYNLKGTIFLISDFVSTYPNYLTWPQIEEMQESGHFCFESHTLSHMQLDKATPEETWNQLNGSRQALEWRLQKPVNFIAYPCGFYDDELERMTREAGFRGGFTVHYGLAAPDENRYFLDRVPIFGCNSHTMLRFKLRLQYAQIFAPLDSLRRQLLKNDHALLAKFVPAP